MFKLFSLILLFLLSGTYIEINLIKMYDNLFPKDVLGTRWSVDCFDWLIGAYKILLLYRYLTTHEFVIPTGDQFYKRFSFEMKSSFYFL
jgi:hypothetical protein